MTNKLRVHFDMTQAETDLMLHLLVEGNDSFTGEEILGRLNDQGYFIVPQLWLIANVKADKFIHGSKKEGTT